MSAGPSAPALATSFTFIIEGLCRVAAARMAKPLTYRERLAAPILMLLWPRLRRLLARFMALAARAAAGPVIPRPTQTPPARAPRPYTRLPRGLGWLIKLLPYEAACYGQLLQHLLAGPDFAALMKAAPRAARMLRPLCRALAIPAPRTPPRPKPVASAAPRPDPNPAPADPSGIALFSLA